MAAGFEPAALAMPLASRRKHSPLSRLLTSTIPNENVLTQSARSGWLPAPGFSQSNTGVFARLTWVLGTTISLRDVSVSPRESVTRRTTV